MADAQRPLATQSVGDGRLARPVIGRAELVYENPYQRITRQTADFGSFSKEYFVSHYGTRVAVVVARGSDILLCRQWRLLMGRLSLEVPGGKLEPEETLEAAAIRECFEETGVRCRNLKPLLFYLAGTDIIDNPCHVFYTADIVEIAQRSDQREAEPPTWVPLARCLELIFAREIVDGLSAMALLAYQRQQGCGGTRG